MNEPGTLPSNEPVGFDESLHKHAVWILTTLASFAMREALLGVVPRMLDPATPDLWTRANEVLRLALCLVVIISMVFGAVYHFEHCRDASRSRPELRPGTPNRDSYAFDFLMAILHLAAVFGWATTLTIHGRGVLGVTPYLAGYWAVLLFNLPWMALSSMARSSPHSREWATMNTLNALFGFGALAGSAYLGADLYTAENASIGVGLVFKTLDLIGLLRSVRLTRILAAWFGSLGN